DDAGVDAVRHLWPTTLSTGGRRPVSEVVEVDEQPETRANLRSLGQMRPCALMDVARGEAVLEVAVLDVLQDRLGGCQFRLIGRAVDASSMALKIVRERQRLEQRALADWAFSAVGKMIYECQRWDEFSIFREMPFESGREFA